jgi:alpha-1,2-mannosyltransferase
MSWAMSAGDATMAGSNRGAQDDCATQDAPPSGRSSVWTRRACLLALGSGLVFTAQLAYQHPWSPAPPYVDLQVYREAALALTHGRDPYAVLPGLSLLFTYPPFALIVFLPTLLLGSSALHAASLGLAVVALLVCIRCALLIGGEAHGPRLVALTFALSALVLPFVPVTNTLRLGQVDLILLAAVLIDLSRSTRRLPQGVVIGIAAGIKLLPGIFIVYFAITRRTRSALVAVAAFAVTVLAGLAVAPGASLAYWTRLVFEQRRVGRVDAVLNQSLRSAALALHWSFMVWLIAVLVTAVVGVAVSVRLHSLGHELLAVGLFAITGLLVAPISWIHYWVWAAPLTVALLMAAWDGRRSQWRLILFLGLVLWIVTFMTWPFRLQVAEWLPGRLEGWAGELFVVAGLTLVAASGVAALRLSLAAERSTLPHRSGGRVGGRRHPAHDSPRGTA